jgi:hypothetical protein
MEKNIQACEPEGAAEHVRRSVLAAATREDPLNAIVGLSPRQQPSTVSWQHLNSLQVAFPAEAKAAQ